MNPVEPIMGRPFSFWVQSRTDPAHRHLVSWLGEPPSCTCHDWSMRNRKHTLETGSPYVCFHMIAAKDQCWSEMLEGVREQLLSQ